MGTSVWLSYWSQQNSNADDGSSGDLAKYLGVYAALGFGNAIGIMLISLCMAIGAVRASRSVRVSPPPVLCVPPVRVSPPPVLCPSRACVLCLHLPSASLASSPTTDLFLAHHPLTTRCPPIQRAARRHAD